jgi:hypothetical protein
VSNLLQALEDVVRRALHIARYAARQVEEMLVGRGLEGEPVEPGGLLAQRGRRGDVSAKQWAAEQRNKGRCAAMFRHNQVFRHRL